MALEQTFEVFSGNDCRLEITIQDEDNGNAPLDISGLLALVWAMGKKPSGAPIITKTLSSGVSVINATTGRVDVILTADELEPLKEAEYYQEMRLTDAQGKKTTLLYGAVTVKENLIRT